MSTFYFPSADTTTHPVLVAGTIPAAFRDAPEVWAVMQYLGSPEYADARQTAPDGARRRRRCVRLPVGQPQRRPEPVHRRSSEQFLDVLRHRSPAGFDASDQMPTEVGSGTFWSESTSLVNGDEDAQTAADNIEASWPTS